MFSFLKVIGIIDEVIIARIDEKYHKIRFERRLDFYIQHTIAKMKKSLKITASTPYNIVVNFNILV